MHSTTDNAGFLPLLIALAKEKGVVGYPGDGANLWGAVHVRDVASLFRLALEKGPAGKQWHAIGDGGVPFREIAEAMGSRLGLPAVSIPADVMMLPGYFGFLTNLVTLNLPASNLITRQTLGWEPAQPSLFADLDNGHYFPADTSAGNNDVATLEKFVTLMQTGDLSGALEMVDEEAVWQEAETLPWSGQWRGPDGFTRLEGAINTSAEMTVRDYAIIEAGEVVEMRLNLVFTSRKSGRRLPMEVVEHYTVREGKIHGANAFYKDTQAVNDLVKHG
jgi:ketosteroid isomerase-like protein